MDHFIVCINSGYFFILFRSIFYQLVDSLISSYESCVFDSISSFTLTMCNALATINHGKFITVLSSYFCVPVLIGFQFLHVEILLFRFSMFPFNGFSNYWRWTSPNIFQLQPTWVTFSHYLILKFNRLSCFLFDYFIHLMISVCSIYSINS